MFSPPLSPPPQQLLCEVKDVFNVLTNFIEVIILQYTHVTSPHCNFKLKQCCQVYLNKAAEKQSEHSEQRRKQILCVCVCLSSRSPKLQDKRAK